MKTVIELDEDPMERARRKLGTTTNKVAERAARLGAIQELLAIDRDWTDIVDNDKVPAVMHHDRWIAPAGTLP